MVSGAEAKRDIWTFLTLLLLFSSIFYALVFSGPDAPKQWGSYAPLFMWCPGLAALITKLVREKAYAGSGGDGGEHATS